MSQVLLMIDTSQMLSLLGKSIFGAGLASGALGMLTLFMYKFADVGRTLMVEYIFSVYCNCIEEQRGRYPSPVVEFLESKAPH